MPSSMPCMLNKPCDLQMTAAPSRLPSMPLPLRRPGRAMAWRCTCQTGPMPSGRPSRSPRATWCSVAPRWGANRAGHAPEEGHAPASPGAVWSSRLLHSPGQHMQACSSVLCVEARSFSHLAALLLLQVDRCILYFPVPLQDVYGSATVWAFGGAWLRWGLLGMWKGTLLCRWTQLPGQDTPTASALGLFGHGPPVSSRRVRSTAMLRCAMHAAPARLHTKLGCLPLEPTSQLWLACPPYALLQRGGQAYGQQGCNHQADRCDRKCQQGGLPASGGRVARRLFLLLGLM